MTAWKKLLTSAVPFGIFAVVGCTQTTTQEDVREARQEYREEAKEVREAKQKADESVTKELKEAQEAKAKLDKTEADFNSEEVRKDYIAKAERRMEALDASVKDLRDRAGELEGDPKDRLNAAIERIEDKCDVARDKLKEIKAAKVEEWPVKRDDVERAMADADTEIQNARRPA